MFNEHETSAGSMRPARRAVALATSLLLAGTLFLGFGFASAVALSLGTVEHFSSGLSRADVPEAIAAGPDGNMWFTDSGAHPAIGRITPSGQITLFTTDLEAGAALGAIAMGPDGNMWFTQAGAHPAIGRVTSSGTITLFRSALSHAPEGIAAGPEGNMWFTEHSGMIGRITTAGQITEFVSGLNSESAPVDIAAGPDGNMWFTDQGKTKAIGRITAAGQIKEFSFGLKYAGGASEPFAIAAGPDGNMWFTDDVKNEALIGRIAPADPEEKIKEYAVGYESVVSIASGPEGNLWFTALKEYNPEHELSPAIVQITTTGEVLDRFEGLVPGASTLGLAAGPDGNMWFTEEIELGGPQAIGRLGVGAPAAPQSAPSILGGAQAGDELHCQGGGWSQWAGQEPSLVEFAFDGYAWLLNGSVIPGQTAQSYTPTSADVGGQLACSTTVTYPLLAVTESAASAAVTITAAPSRPVTAPAAAAAILHIPRQTDAVTAAGALKLTVRCEDAVCSGTVKLSAKVRRTSGRGRRRRTITVSTQIASASYSGLAVGTDTVSLKLIAAGRMLLARGGYRLAATASARYLSSASAYALAAGTLDLKGQRPKRKRK